MRNFSHFLNWWSNNPSYFKIKTDIKLEYFFAFFFIFPFDAYHFPLNFNQKGIKYFSICHRYLSKYWNIQHLKSWTQWLFRRIVCIPNSTYCISCLHSCWYSFVNFQHIDLLSEMLSKWQTNSKRTWSENLTRFKLSQCKFCFFNSSSNFSVSFPFHTPRADFLVIQMHLISLPKSENWIQK